MRCWAQRRAWRWIAVQARRLSFAQDDTISMRFPADQLRAQSLGDAEHGAHLMHCSKNKMETTCEVLPKSSQEVWLSSLLESIHHWTA